MPPLTAYSSRREWTFDCSWDDGKVQPSDVASNCLKEDVFLWFVAVRHLVLYFGDCFKLRNKDLLLLKYRKEG